MVAVSFTGSKLVFEIEGFDQVWALKTRLEIPIEHVYDAVVDPPAVHDWWKGIRLMGTQMPGILTAGTFYYHEEKVFWDVHDPVRAIGISLHDERYKELIIEVENPGDVVEMIQAAIRQGA